MKVKKQILKEVPLGTSVEIADQKMRSLGFECEKRKNQGPFSDQASNRTYENVEYIVCHQQRVVVGVSDWVWVVGLPYDKNNLVTNVFVQVVNRNYL